MRASGNFSGFGAGLGLQGSEGGRQEFDRRGGCQDGAADVRTVRRWPVSSLADEEYVREEALRDGATLPPTRKNGRRKIFRPSIYDTHSPDLSPNLFCIQIIPDNTPPGKEGAPLLEWVPAQKYETSRCSLMRKSTPNIPGNGAGSRPAAGRVPGPFMVPEPGTGDKRKSSPCRKWGI